MSLVLAVVPVTCVSALFIITITILAVVRTRKKVGTTCTNRTGVTKQGELPKNVFFLYSYMYTYPLQIR